jgi:hypothetical protein
MLRSGRLSDLDGMELIFQWNKLLWELCCRSMLEDILERIYIQLRA